MALLEVDDIHTFYGNIEALKGVSLTVEEGEVVTLIGSNGAGKSTTLRSISGLTPPREGSIRFDGKEIGETPPQEIVRLGISQSPEGRKCFQRMTVRENLELGAYLRRDTDVAGDLERVFELFPRLQERERQKAGTMSGGEQQMLAIGRALMARPSCCCSTSRRWASPRSSSSASTRPWRDQPAGHHDPARRAERQLRARGLRARLRARNRQRRPQRHAGELRDNPEVQRAYLGAIDGSSRHRPEALFLLFGWLLSAIVGSYLSERKGYGEKPGLATGLLLFVVGVVIWLVWPARPGRSGARGAQAHRRPRRRSPTGRTAPRWLKFDANCA